MKNSILGAILISFVYSMSVFAVGGVEIGIQTEPVLSDILERAVGSQPGRVHFTPAAQSNTVFADYMSVNSTCPRASAVNQFFNPTVYNVDNTGRGANLFSRFRFATESKAIEYAASVAVSLAVGALFDVVKTGYAKYYGSSEGQEQEPEKDPLFVAQVLALKREREVLSVIESEITKSEISAKTANEKDLCKKSRENFELMRKTHVEKMAAVTEMLAKKSSMTTSPVTV